MQRNQPNPAPPQPSDENTVVEQVGQTIVENSVALKDANGMDLKPDSMNGQKFEQETKKNGTNVKDNKQEEKSKKQLKKETSNPIVKNLVTIGVAAIVLGLVLAFVVNRYFGILIVLLGSACVIACVYLPVGIKAK